MIKYIQKLFLFRCQIKNMFIFFFAKILMYKTRMKTFIKEERNYSQMRRETYINKYIMHLIINIVYKSFDKNYVSNLNKQHFK